MENTTVRFGHNRIFKDTKRLFKDDKLKDISLFGRIFFGLPATLIGGLLSKLTRADYYNPFTKTAVVYSDVPFIGIHEMGHAKDFQDKKYPTLYSLFRKTYVGALYQEARASAIAHEYLKGKEPTGRYSVPAFASYLIPGALHPLFRIPLLVGLPLVGLGAAVLKGIKNYLVKRRENRE